MKKIIYPLMGLLFCYFSFADSTLTDQERKAAIEQLKQSKEMLLAAVKGLSTAQLNFKSSPESWSVAECTEHLAITEGSFFGMVEGSLKNPADASKRSEVKMSDEDVLKMITDRTRKVKTNERFVPSGKFGSFEGSLKEYTTLRDAHIEYVKTTKDDLRDRYQKFKFGTVDEYQVILFMAGHNKRHVAQIEEVKADPNFPKK